VLIVLVIILLLFSLSTCEDDTTSTVLSSGGMLNSLRSFVDNFDAIFSCFWRKGVHGVKLP
jgi:hypothetical protein